MASLQQLKNRLSGKTTEEPTPKKTPLSEKITQSEKISLPEPPESEIPSVPTLEIEEARYLLSLIAKTDFSGKDIQIVYNTALKLQEIIQENLNKDNLNDNG